MAGQGENERGHLSFRVLRRETRFYSRGWRNVEAGVFWHSVAALATERHVWPNVGVQRRVKRVRCNAGLGPTVPVIVQAHWNAVTRLPSLLQAEPEGRPRERSNSRFRAE